MAHNLRDHEDFELGIEVFEGSVCRTEPGPLRPGDSLEGQVLLTSKLVLSITRVEIRFIGLQRVFVIPTDPGIRDRTGSRSTWTFLDVTYPIYDVEALGPRRTYRFPFRFIMPEASGNEDLPILCQRLPPSFNRQNSYFDKWDLVPRPEAAITYFLRTIVTFRKSNGLEVSNSVTAEEKKDIDFLPYTEVQPPTHILSFPGEFITRVERQLRKHLFGRRLGTLTVVTSEPKALVYSSENVHATTDLVLRIFFNANSHSLHPLHNSSFTISSVLRAKTYYSARSLSCVPKQTLLSDDSLLRLHDDVLKVGESKYQNLKWTWLPPDDQAENLAARQSDSLSQFNGNTSIKTERSASSNEVFNTPSASSSAENTLESGGEKGTWVTSIRIPISSVQRLQPTFCSKLVARFYSIPLRIRINGAYAEKIDCEVPLQVVHTRRMPEANLVQEDASPHCLGRAVILSQGDELPQYSAS
ncbi:hypothetical protein B0J13DRAFT_150485 [Dactylonectria estremocensis]|uniref:Arrestin-like N-terminal domain-containing protein n=1 Tax=Dactylonectria estremocensis TaxID=1079267 RepID=A0A9P9IJX8_9HYPO|nr:hypothetical protein B0J13DRAFT_150485 [Dactylonectria estremocensis]